jgi:cytoskeleton protein RodZ
MQMDSAPLMAQLDMVLEKPVNSLAVSDSPPAEMPHSGSAVSQRSKLVVLMGAVRGACSIGIFSDGRQSVVIA